ncbi:MAG: hypothetical protein P8Y97_17925, partial [Candidatus Lokiarchaeota archaeon]
FYHAQSHSIGTYKFSLIAERISFILGLSSLSFAMKLHTIFLFLLIKNVEGMACLNFISFPAPLANTSIL